MKEHERAIGERLGDMDDTEAMQGLQARVKELEGQLGKMHELERHVRAERNYFKSEMEDGRSNAKRQEELLRQSHSDFAKQAERADKVFTLFSGDSQQQALQGLADALKQMLAVFPPEFDEKWAESSGEKIQVQAWKQARAALDAAKLFLEAK